MGLLPEPLQMVLDDFSMRHQLTSWTVTPGLDGVSSTIHIHWRSSSNHPLTTHPWMVDRNTGFLDTGDSDSDYNGGVSSEEATTGATTEMDTGGDTGHGTSIRTATLETSPSLIIEGLDLTGSSARSNDDSEMSRSRLVEVRNPWELRDVFENGDSDLDLRGSLARSNNVGPRTGYSEEQQEVKDSDTGRSSLSLLTREEWLSVYECGRLREQMRRVREAILHMEEAAYVRDNSTKNSYHKTRIETHSQIETEIPNETEPQSNNDTQPAGENQLEIGNKAGTEIRIETHNDLRTPPKMETKTKTIHAVPLTCTTAASTRPASSPQSISPANSDTQPAGENQLEIGNKAGTEIRIESHNDLRTPPKMETKTKTIHAVPLTCTTAASTRPTSSPQSISPAKQVWTTPMLAGAQNKANSDLLTMKPDPASALKDAGDAMSWYHRPQVCAGSPPVTCNYGNCGRMEANSDRDNINETSDGNKEDAERDNISGYANDDEDLLIGSCTKKRVQKGQGLYFTDMNKVYDHDKKSPEQKLHINHSGQNGYADIMNDHEGEIDNDDWSVQLCSKNRTVHFNKAKSNDYATKQKPMAQPINSPGLNSRFPQATATGQSQVSCRSTLVITDDPKTPLILATVGGTQSEQISTTVGAGVGISSAIDPLGGSSNSSSRQHRCGGGLLSETLCPAQSANGLHEGQHVTNHVVCMVESRDTSGQNDGDTKLDIPNRGLMDSSSQNKWISSGNSENKRYSSPGEWECQDNTGPPKQIEFLCKSKKDNIEKVQQQLEMDVGGEAYRQNKWPFSNRRECKSNADLNSENIAVVKETARKLKSISTVDTGRSNASLQHEALQFGKGSIGITRTQKHRECQCTEAIGDLSSSGISQQNESDIGDGVILRGRVPISGGKDRGLRQKWEAESTQSSLSYQDSDEELRNYTTSSPITPPSPVSMATGLTNGSRQMGLLQCTNQSGEPIHTGTDSNVGVDWWAEHGGRSVGFSSDISRFARPEGQQANKSCQTSLINPIRHRDRNVHSWVDSNANGVSQYSCHNRKVDSNANRPSSVETDMDGNLSLLCSTPLTSILNAPHTSHRQPHCGSGGTSMGHKSYDSQDITSQLRFSPIKSLDNFQNGEETFCKEMQNLDGGKFPTFHDGASPEVTDLDQLLLSPSGELEGSYHYINSTSQYSPLNDLSPSIRGVISRTNIGPTTDITLHTDTGSLTQDQPIYWDLLANIRQHQGHLVFCKVVVDWVSIKALRAQVGELCVLYLVSAKLCQFVTPRFGWEYQKHCDVINRHQPISDVRVMGNAAEVWYAAEVQDMKEQTVEHIMRMSETIRCLNTIRND